MELSRELMVERRYVNLPVKNGAPKRTMTFVVNGRPVRQFEVDLADAEPDFWVFSDVSAFRGQRLTVEVDALGVGSKALESITQSDEITGGENLYREKLRPQFHFSSRRGWNNDPNGLMYYRGEYHLFYQHNPYGIQWGNMHWGHAVSTDLVHWRELPIALYPDKLGTIFSGSGVVDWRNTTGFQRGAEKTLVCVYTSAGEPFTQSIAYSNDCGRTWTKYAGNPVLGHIVAHNRDPKVVWHDPTRKWVMALYLDKNDYALFSSPDLKQWTRLCGIELPACSECPDFFELPVDGDAADTRWVFWGANGSHLLGRFDGSTFKREGGLHRYAGQGDSYAAQTWSDIPAQDGRRIQIAWFRVNLPGMPFNQMMTFPCELTLRTTRAGIRLFSQPVKEIETIHAKTHTWKEETLEEGDKVLADITGDLFDIRAEFSVGDATEFGFTIRGIPVVYSAEKEELRCMDKTAPLQQAAGRIRLQLLVDRASIEIFGNDGIVAMPIGVIPPDDKGSLAVFSRGGSTTVHSLEVHELESAWKR